MTEFQDPEPAHRLRAELKAWEKTFTAANGGRKAAREDIKKDPVIAQKYKEYNKLTGRAAARDAARAATITPPKPQKRQRETIEDDAHSTEASKRSRQLRPVEIDPYDAPLQVTPSAVRTSVGPTPQKNGQVLGIFDDLSPLVMGKDTPSRKPHATLHTLSASNTPSRPRFVDVQMVEGLTPSRLGRTPQRIRYQHKADELVTPSAQRFTKKSPVGSGKARHDETPAFLQRYHNKLGPLAENGNEVLETVNFSPVAIRLPPRPVGRGLSALVQGLRDIEDERLDEELDMLREMEAEESGGVSLPKKPRVSVEESQVCETIELPLGADGERPASEDDGAVRVDESQPGRKWKKRGQKRTTRKVNIVPSTAKWKPEPEWKVGKEDSELQDSEAENRPENEKAKEKVGLRKKISATAHANFRALKIRSKNFKGKGGRFGGRRR